jgi:hypothetical protein
MEPQPAVQHGQLSMHQWSDMVQGNDADVRAAEAAMAAVTLGTQAVTTRERHTHTQPCPPSAPLSTGPRGALSAVC